MHVLIEDNHLLGVQKLTGELTQSDGTDRPSLHERAKAYLKRKYRKPGRVFLGLVHRLDRVAAGVVLFARTSKAAARLSDQIRSRTVNKTYWAVVEGKPTPSRATLEGWLLREGSRSRILEQEVPGAQSCRLSYDRLRHDGDRSLLAIELETGRKHQIRAQLATRGHPIVGDHAYGSRTEYKPHGIALLALRLAFDHPTLGERIEIEAVIPDDWPLLP